MQSRKYAAKVARTLKALSEKNTTLAEKSKVDMHAPDRRLRIHCVQAVPAPRGEKPCRAGKVPGGQGWLARRRASGT
ncbi:hypothetical protein PPH41_41165, partial [Burkholderia gladioli]|nr:hypothetical protein [Burkholderia gladioli]